MNNKIVFTGGHHNSTIIVARLLAQKGHKIIWFGHKFSTQNDHNFSQEYQDLQKTNFQFVNLKSGKIYRGGTFEYLKLIKAYLFCFQKLIKIKPDLVVSFGGYLAVPVVLAGKSIGIKCISHEQTQSLGLANRFMLKFIDKLYTAWPLKNYPQNSKLSHIGLPINFQDFNKNIKLPFKQNKPLLVISGGKQGSHAINMAIKPILPQLLERYNIAHQTGDNSVTSDKIRFENLKKQLAPEIKDSYYPFAYHHHFKTILKQADMIIGRSGAHTVYEIIYIKKKLLAVPLPSSSGDEQFKNAQILKRFNLAVILKQDELSSESLLEKIKTLKNLKPKHKEVNDFINKSLPLDAAEKLTQEIQNLLN
jgi:UDP-N-acetylglucosamine--N-acetylmuramyl-(pentapeptide) pyrophosphoryl-undecaprenol N-acetylglucosamine transferase